MPLNSVPLNSFPVVASSYLGLAAKSKALVSLDVQAGWCLQDCSCHLHTRMGLQS